MKKIISWLLLLFLFLLPWQTRFIYQPGSLNGGAWEYGTLSIYATELLLGLAILLALVSAWRERIWRQTVDAPARSRRRRTLVLFGLGLIFLLTAILTSPLPAVTAQWVSWVIEGAAAVALLKIYVNDSRAAGLAFWLGGAGQGLLAVGQFFTQTVIANKWLGLAAHAPSQLGDFVIEAGGERWLRAYGAFGSPNILGGYLAVAWVIGFLTYPLLRGRARYWVAAGQLIILSGLIFSFSRGAWLAAVGGIIVTVIATRKRFYPLLAKSLLYSFLLIIALLLIFPPLFSARFSAASRLEAKSFTERRSQWAAAGQMITRSPLWGVGPGIYTAAQYQQNPRLPAWQYQPVHNSYLLALAEVGLVGFLILILMIFYFLKYIWRQNKFFLPVVAVVMLSAFFDHFWWSLYAGQMLGWAILGLSIVVDNYPEAVS
ncbi:MAG: O-antigen ligase family protein [Candidatus Magasanikbacteria bacterium]|nr:O-antigen ligase family protein [Candidatus Magasanikbacteria bacterium]